MKNRVALVTGAARGIGAAIAVALEEAGAQVLTPTRAELDLENSASIADFLAQNAPKIEILVNNAGINRLGALETLDEVAWAAMVQVNLTAPLRLIGGVLPAMKARGWGRILNLSSIFSLVTKEERGAYSAVKAGLNGLTRTAALEGAPFGVLVNSLAPGYVETALTRQNNSPAALEEICAAIPLKRLAQPAELAACARWLCSEENSYLTGQTIVADGGWTLR